MGKPAEKKQSTNTASNDAAGPKSSFGSTNELHANLKQRQSKELIVGLCGPIGCGIKAVKTQFERVLLDEGYEVFHIRVSKVIETCLATINTPVSYSSSNRAERYNQLMSAGNDLRSMKGDSVCADLAILEIKKLREVAANGQEIKDSKAVGLEKRAYIIDQLKRPEEVSALKAVYQNAFYSIGVLCDEVRRETCLKDEGISADLAHSLIMRDKNESLEHGQSLEKTLYHADFFINNSDPNSSIIAAQFGRFLKLVHGGRGVTPTVEEFGMYSAHAASLQSACLSRQVGASIVDSEGVLLAVGHNDVPKFGGGLYVEDDNLFSGIRDSRCVHRDQQCHNDLHKTKLRNTIEEIISESFQELGPGLVGGVTIDAGELADKIAEKSQIKSLIEFSRAIHAEMDCILSLARTGKAISKGSTLYTTTYPCHNCARHIIAAGIKNVKYIQPYEKSLAISLHDDAMSHSPVENKVFVQSFQGVAPSRYQAFFSNTTPRKGPEGNVIITDKGNRKQVHEEFVDSYIEREIKVASEVMKMLGEEEPQ